jgi:hypothetical protein
MKDLSILHDHEKIRQRIGSEKLQIVRALWQNGIFDVQINGNRDLFESVNRVHLSCQPADKKKKKNKDQGIGGLASLKNHSPLLTENWIFIPLNYL